MQVRLSAGRQAVLAQPPLARGGGYIPPWELFLIFVYTKPKRILNILLLLGF